MPDGSRVVQTDGVTPTVNGSQLHFNRMDGGKVGQYVCEGNNGVEKVQMSAFLTTFGKKTCQYVSKNICVSKRFWYIFWLNIY